MSESPQAAGPAILARSAAEAVRSLNHATLDGTGPAAAVSGAGLFISGARASAVALVRDLDHAQQQLAAVNGGPGQKDTLS